MKKFIPSFILIGVGALCVAVYWIIGSQVTIDGRIIEPFFLTAGGAILIAAGVVVGVFVALTALIKVIIKKTKNKPIL
jgi:hypothetical protein